MQSNLSEATFCRELLNHTYKISCFTDMVHIENFKPQIVYMKNFSNVIKL